MTTYPRALQETQFKLRSEFEPKGDQPQAIKSLVAYLREGADRQVLLGVTGSGKTFTMANVIAELNRPALVLAHNKTLAAQLYSEFAELFPDNAVRYFVSYYDYYQPEAYIPSTDTYIEKDSSVNDEIDKLRHAATKALLERRDVIVVASVSCIYGLGDPKAYFEMIVFLETGDVLDRDELLSRLVGLQYERDDIEFFPGSFRVRGDVVDVCPASDSERSIRLEFFGDRLEEISEIERATGRTVRSLDNCCIYPASHFVAQPETLDRARVTIAQELQTRLAQLRSQDKTLEAHRLEQRTLYDLELIEEMGFCSGIENYSRHLTQRLAGEPPPTLIDYFPEDSLFFIDESHVTIGQLVGMYRGDRARKQTLVEHGFRLPSAMDNRPLRFEEFLQRTPQLVYVSATPGAYEIKESNGRIVEQLIRPTGLLDPRLEVRPAADQVEDFVAELRTVISRNERGIVTTLTKRMAEHLCDYYQTLGLRVRYLHSDITTLDRVQIIRGLQDGEFDLLVGVNLLREGLDLPAVSLIGIMDADKEGFLRSSTALIQTIGRAARNVNGFVILYGDKITGSMRQAIEETNRRREKQESYNVIHGIVPETVRRPRQSLLVSEQVKACQELGMGELELPRTQQEGIKKLAMLREEMKSFAKKQEFERAAQVRDAMIALERYLLNL